MLYKPTMRVIIPTGVKTVLGLHMEREPVESVPVSDTEALREAFERVRQRGIQTVPHPKSFPPISHTPSLRTSKAKSWAEFVRSTEYWTIDDVKGAKRIQRWYSPPRKSHFEPDIASVIDFEPETSIDKIFEALIQEIQATASNPE